MRKALAVGVIAVLVHGLAAVPVSAEKKPTKVPQYTAKELEAGLLTLTDIPGGFAEEPGSGSPPAPSQTGGFCDGPNFWARAETAGAIANARTAYIQGQSPIVREALLAFDSIKDARAFMKSERAANDTCDSWEAVDGVTGVNWRLTNRRLRFPRVGNNQRFAFEITAQEQAEIDPRQSILDTVYVRVANIVVMVQEVFFPSDFWELPRYVAVAVSNAAGIIKSS